MPSFDLNSLFQSDPAAQELGLQMIGDQRSADKASLEQILMKIDQEKQMFPHELRAKQLGNQTQEAQLPGILESNRALKYSNDFNEQTMGPKLQQALSQYKGKMTKEQFDDLVATGNIFTQAGQLLSDIPGLTSHSRAREILKDKYLPEFDQVPPQALGQVIRYMGQNMSQLQPDYVKKANLEGIKIEGKKTVEEEKAIRAKELAAFKATLQEKLAQAKTTAQKDPTTARALANKLFLAAQQESDPDRKAVLMEQAQGFNEIAFAEIERRAAATNAAKPDLGKLGIETNPLPQAPGLPGTQPTQQPGANKPASLVDVQKMYPGVPPEKLKEAYKRKFGVDLQ